MLERGYILNPDQEIDAYLAGVAQPRRVRIYHSENFDLPFPENLKNRLNEMGIIEDNIRGITFGYGIWINSKHIDNRELIIHELTHVMQYEKLGLTQFLSKYIDESLVNGYFFNSLEVEARKITNEILQREK